MITALTTVETGEFERHKATIRAGQQTFVEVGLAYLAIREQRLYRATHGTFEEFCRTEFALCKREVNRTIEAAEVVKRLGPIGPTVEKKAQVRPLTKLPASEQPAAWQAAVERSGGAAPTAKVVAAVVAERRPAVEVMALLPLAKARHAGQCVAISLAPATRSAAVKWVATGEPLLRIDLTMPVNGDVDALIPDARTLRAQLRAAVEEFLSQQGWEKPRGNPPQGTKGGNPPQTESGKTPRAETKTKTRKAKQ